MNSPKHLFFMRHGKAGWNDNTEDDHSRPLSRIGVREVINTSKKIREIFSPDLIISATAYRTIKTAEIAGANLGYKNEILFVKNLYNGEESKILQAVKSIPQKHSNVLIIAHNPALSAVVSRIYSITQEIPTGGAVGFKSGCESWGSFLENNPEPVFSNF